MILFFSAARVVFFGYTVKQLEDGHAALMRLAFARLMFDLPPGIDPDLIILGNERADMPRKRADGTISLGGVLLALLQAQTLPKYHHAMRQAWHHPIKSLPKVQLALYRRLMKAITTPNPSLAAQRLGAALHTLQDTYTLGHADREDNGDPFSPLLRVHYSPSKIHPLISAHDRIWADAENTRLTPEAAAALHATLAALELFTVHWRHSADAASQAAAEFVERYAPIRGKPFQKPAQF